MNKFRMVIFCVCLAVLCAPGAALASGYSVSDQGAKAVSMGYAFVAQADDPSALYYNPAGLVQTEGVQAMAGVSLIFPGMEFTSTTKTPGLNTYWGKNSKINEDEFAVPHLYLTQKYNEKVAWGIGGFSNYGLTTDWPDHWDGRYTSGGIWAEIKTESINPVIAYRPWEFMSISAGYVAQYMEAELRNKIVMPPAFGPDGEFKVAGDDWGSGWNTGVMFFLPENVRIGASYRSEIHHDLAGDMQVYGNPLINTYSGGVLDINLPAILQVGVSWAQAPFTVEFDYRWVQWSSYDILQMNVDKNGQVIEMVKDWDDSSSFHLGGSYNIVKNLFLRAGLTFEPECIPDSHLDLDVPGGDRWIWSCGFGGNYGHWVADFYYSYLYNQDKTFNNENGDYVYYTPFPTKGRLTGEIHDVRAHLAGVSLTYKF